MNDNQQARYLTGRQNKREAVLEVSGWTKLKRWWDG